MKDLANNLTEGKGNSFKVIVSKEVYEVYLKTMETITRRDIENKTK